MSKLQLILLGQFECLLSSGQRISLSMRKAEVLLAYLALAPGIRHPRERLINLLWSDRGEEQARNSLRQCLSAIRKSLGDGADLILQIDRTTVSLKPGLIDVDALEFEQLASQGDFESLSTAAGLYRGEFLEGISIRDAASQDWLDGERARFKRQFIEILANLGETQLISHDFSAAIKSTERLVEQDPLGESGWRLLMRSYADSGDRSHALQAFKRCEKSIRDELDVDPEAATIDLRDRIASGDNKTAAAPADKPVLPIATPAVTASGNAETPTEAATNSDHSIAVLPFDNLSGDPEQEYFSDGITDSIILNLSMFPGLQVKSRNSSFAFKQQIKSPGEISRELEVGYIVEGSIRKSQEKVRITVQLIEAASGNQVWGKRYDADIDNLFDLEEELSRTIAATVTGQIESDLQRIAITRSAAHQDAYELLLSGIYHCQKVTVVDTQVAIEKLNQCLVLDPDNVRAHVVLYTCHILDSVEHWVPDPPASAQLAGEHIEKALLLDPENGSVLAAYAEYLVFGKKPGQAPRYVDKALQKNPNDADAISVKAFTLQALGEHAQALQLAELAQRLDPYHPWVDWNLTECQICSGQYEEALNTIAQSNNDPGLLRLYSVVANIKLDRQAQAQQALTDLLDKCRTDMLSMPSTRESWLQFCRNYIPFEGSDFPEDVVDCLVQAGLEEHLSSPAGPDQSTEHSIAVLPFDNLSGDPEQEYFSDGITDSIILNLSMFPGLQVKSRNSSFAFKQQIKNPGEISRELNVDYIVEGSIRKSVDRIRITVQLIEAASGNQVWGKRYDAEIENLFDLEEELSRTIAATVTGQIESDLQRIAITRGATDLQAYDLLLSGTYHLKLADRDNVAIAIKEFNQCLLQDPGNAVAHARLFSCHDLNVLDHWTDDVQHSRKLAAEHIHKAFSLNPDLGLVQVAYADYLIFNQQFDEAEYQLKRAMDTNPNDTEAIAILAVGLSTQGKAEPALEQAELALKLDPYHGWAKWIKAESQFFCGRYEDCVATIADTDNTPAFIQVYAVAAYIKLGNLDNAKKALERFLRFCNETMLSMPDSIQGWLEYYRDNAPFADPQINQDIIDCLVQAGLQDQLIQVQQEDGSSRQAGVLVLPFSNLSGDPQQEYFSDGITESIILSLSSSQGLAVKSRHTSFAYKDSALSVSQIGTELEVQYIVEGSIRKHGDQVRITVQLGETDSGNQVWGKRYDKPLDQLFALEEELVQTIAGTISGRIGREIRINSEQKPASDLKSYDHLMRGWYHGERFTPEDIKLANELFKKCVEIDPDNAEGHALIAGSNNTLVYENWCADPQLARSTSRHHIRRALELGPDNAYAHAFMAEDILLDREYKQALFHSDRAIELDPTLPDGYSMKAYTLSLMGRTEEALKLVDLSLQIDPYHYYMGWNGGGVYRSAGEYQKAIEIFRTIPFPPTSLHAEIAACLVGLGEIEEAKAEMAQYLQNAHQQMPDYPVSKEAWRKLWYDNFSYQHEQDFNVFFDQLLVAGLCDGTTEDRDDMPSLLVLPFSNLSGDPEQEYFSDGITESVIVNLSSFSELNVKSRHTSFAFRNSEKSIDEIAAELTVQYIVEGSIRKFGDKVRITVQIGETASGNQLWGKRFESDLEELFELEEELVTSISGSIGGRISKDLKSVSMHKPAKDLKSYDYLMRGVHHLEKFNAADIAIARAQFQKCLEHDPENSEAHAMMGVSHLTELFENWSVERAESTRLMFLHSEKALQLEPENSVGHAFMAEALMYSGNFERAEHHVERAIELNPNLPDGYAIKGSFLASTRCYDEALEYADKSLQIDPYHFYMCWNAGEVFRECGQYERAVRTFRSMSHIPSSVYAQIAASLAGLGKIDEARAEMQRYLESARRQMPNCPTNEKEWHAYWSQYLPYQHPEDAEPFFQLLLTAGLCDEVTLPPDNQPSIAVLPFENMSGDPEQEYFSDGITASVILSLGLFDGLTVKSQNSSFAFKGSGKSSEEIADELNVSYLVEGSIRKSAHKVRISVQLIESETGNQVWGKQYDAELEDILELEQEMSQTIAGTISGRIGHKIQQSAVRKSARNLQSYDYLLRGLYYFGKFTASDFALARQEIKKCLEIDPKNATAHTNLGMIHWVEILEGWTGDQPASEKLTRLHLETAIDIEPDNSLAHSYFGEYLFFKRDFEQSEFHVDKAIELNPTASEGYVVKADLLAMTRRIEEALPYADKCLQLDPHSIGAGWAAGGVYLGAGQFEKAIKTYRSISHPPPSIHASIAVCFNGLGLEEETRKEMKRYHELAKRDMSNYPTDRNTWRNLWQTYLPYRHKEDFETAFEHLVEAGLLEKQAGPVEELPSIAVLPFENMSGDPEQDHFSDGITTDIIATLSRFEHMRTVSRYSVLQYKNQHTSIPEIAQQQKVRYILEGSVRKSGNSIRVSAELIDSRDQKICWSESYDRDLDDLFAVQDEITKNIALAMKVQLDDGEMALHRSTGTSNIKAWQLTLAAIDLQDTYIRENILEARRMAKQAIDLDPGYPYAWVALGWTHWQEVYSGWSDSPEDSLAEAEKAQQKALDLLPLYSEAWSLGGLIHLMRHKPTQALEYCRKAVELQPGNAEIQALMAFCLIYVGDYESARQHEQTMLKLCPVLPNWYFLLGGEIAQIQGEYETAAHCYQQGIDVEPDSPLCRFYLIDVMMEQGNETRARELADEIKALDKQVKGRGLVRTISQDKALRERFRANLEKFDLY